jgi:hypothetical protein
MAIYDCKKNQPDKNLHIKREHIMENEVLRG